ncbi:hypothetical protein WJ96_05720 [Burkholderia ubonensis]|uniref:Uncharacterized protein n=1 Tax=Burkholderia ubonensis TaxID=101571 RepID=A0AAW3MZ19_9BURK|nr:hypothetical protein [Burkholderia ubonensis]KVP96723.1 hypothetical protein WJ97_12650 [Burkholderia ubonensis]KVP98067.1 hypothetical protein WJ96_05720 [Burkholderia ubonensis]KVZ92764.1 hypothetical protein WL25_17380 [Burkholderia ubonensis]
MNTPEQRQARIQQLESRLEELRQSTRELEEELSQLRSNDTPEDREHLARQWWTELRVGLIITLEEFERFLDECRELKQISPAAACNKFRDRLELRMQEVTKYIRLL